MKKEDEAAAGGVPDKGAQAAIAVDVGNTGNDQGQGQPEADHSDFDMEKLFEEDDGGIDEKTDRKSSRHVKEPEPTGPHPPSELANKNEANDSSLAKLTGCDDGGKGQDVLQIALESQMATMYPDKFGPQETAEPTETKDAEAEGAKTLETQIVVAQPTAAEAEAAAADHIKQTQPETAGPAETKAAEQTEQHNQEQKEAPAAAAEAFEAEAKATEAEDGATHPVEVTMPRPDLPEPVLDSQTVIESKPAATVTDKDELEHEVKEKEKEHAEEESKEKEEQHEVTAVKEKEKEHEEEESKEKEEQQEVTAVKEKEKEHEEEESKEKEEQQEVTAVKEKEKEHEEEESKKKEEQHEVPEEEEKEKGPAAGALPEKEVKTKDNSAELLVTPPPKVRRIDEVQYGYRVLVVNKTVCQSQYVCNMYYVMICNVSKYVTFYVSIEMDPVSVSDVMSCSCSMWMWFVISYSYLSVLLYTLYCECAWWVM